MSTTDELESVDEPILRQFHPKSFRWDAVDPDSEQIIGIHLEGFLGQAVEEHPQEIEILDYAELRGMTPIEVWALQWKKLRIWPRLVDPIRAIHAADIPQGKVRAVSLLLEAEGKHWGIAGDPAA